MNIRELRLFKHLSETLHFGRTSQACNITPSGLTRAMQRLESELGQELLYRNRRTVQLTQAGKIFLEYAEETIQNFNNLQEKLNRDNKLKGHLTVYCSVTAILSILPEILNRFRSIHPEVQLHLETGDAAKALDKLKSREADIAVAAVPDNLSPDFDFIELTSTPLIFIGPVEGGIRKATNIDWKKTPVIVPERGLSRDRVDRWFSRKNIQPEIYSQVAGNEAIIAMVAIGFGIGVVPELVLEKSPLKEQVATIGIDPHLKPFSVGICTLRESRSNRITGAFTTMATGESR